MAPAISVIVPVYNAELFLQECVDSLLAQTFRDVEFIFVDDGSTDCSVEILEEYKKKDDRIQILRQQNQYAGVARNNGMKAAAGKYLIFLDADDFFAPTMLEEAFYCAEENGAEIVVFSFYYCDNVTRQLTPRAKTDLPDNAFSVNQCGSSFFADVYAAPWNKLYLREFVIKSGIQFKPIRKFNDNYFILITTCLANRIVFLDKRLVYYRVNNDKSLQGNSASGRELFLDALAPVKKEFQRRGIFDGNIQAAFCRFACNSINHLWGISERTVPSRQSFYKTVKDRMIPDVFDSVEDFANDSLTSDLFESADFSDFLLKRLATEETHTKELRGKIKTLYDTTVPKSSSTYRLGEALLFLPRTVQRLFRHKK